MVGWFIGIWVGSWVYWGYEGGLLGIRYGGGLGWRVLVKDWNLAWGYGNNWGYGFGSLGAVQACAGWVIPLAVCDGVVEVRVGEVTEDGQRGSVDEAVAAYSFWFSITNIIALVGRVR